MIAKLKNKLGRVATLAIYLFISLMPEFAMALSKSPYPDSPVIEDILFDWSTRKQFAPGSDNWPVTWAADGNQYAAWGDGGGFNGTNQKGRASLGVARIEGDANSYKGYNVWGGYQAENPAQFTGKSYGIISVAGVLYMWVIPDYPDDPAGLKGERDHYRYIQLARSTNNGRTWQRSSWKFLGTENVIIPTFLNFGRDNAGALDDYVYAYFIQPERPGMHQKEKGLIVHKPGALFLARVHKTKMWAGKSSFQFFRGFDSSGTPLWGSISNKKPVFQDPNGAGWTVSAAYNAGLKRVLLFTQHTEDGKGYYGIFDAPKPWGPWTTAKYFDENNYFGKGVLTGELFSFIFSNKWTSADGIHTTFLYTGTTVNDALNLVKGTYVLKNASTPPPVVNISSPTNGVTFNAGQQVTFKGKGDHKHWKVTRGDTGAVVATGNQWYLDLKVPNDMPSGAILTVTLTADGGSDTDTHPVLGGSPIQTGSILRFEAEEAQSQSTFSPYQWVQDSTASGGKAVISGGESSLDVTPGNGIATYDFELQDAMDVAIWVRVKNPNPKSDSFWMDVTGDSLGASLWSLDPDSSEWKWLKWKQVSLNSGAHTLTVMRREKNTQYDRIIVTSDLTLVPSGKGD